MFSIRGGESILGDSTANQGSPTLFVQADDDGWIGGRNWVHVRQSQIFRHCKTRTEPILSSGESGVVCRNEKWDQVLGVLRWLTPKQVVTKLDLGLHRLRRVRRRS
jgi:hypothetical protein